MASAAVYLDEAHEPPSAMSGERVESTGRTEAPRRRRRAISPEAEGSGILQLYEARGATSSRVIYSGLASAKTYSVEVVPAPAYDHVPALRAKWGGDCDALFAELVDAAPGELAALITFEEVSEADLSFAAEFMGAATNSNLVRATLLPLLKHPVAPVREGAVYGLKRHLDDRSRNMLARLAAADPSAGVRSAAGEILEDD